MKINTYNLTVQFYKGTIKHIHTHLGLSLTALEYYKNYYKETYDIVKTNIETNFKTNMTTN